MRTSQAARYARWAASAAVVITVLVGGMFAHRAGQAARARKEAPPAVPASVQQRSAEFSFSKVEGDRTLFTVRASRATEFKQGNNSLLEEVSITIFGRTGQRADKIHTKSCEYNSSTGQVVCRGEVQIDLQSAQEERTHQTAPPGPGATARVVRVEAKNVSFARETGEARSAEAVTFRFPYGHGRAVGMTYQSADGVVHLDRNVEFMLERGADRPAPAGAIEPVSIQGDSLDYRHSERRVYLHGPVHAQQGGRELVAGEFDVELDADLHPRRLVAAAGNLGGQPELRAVERNAQARLAANEFAALLAPEGWVERILAIGYVHGIRRGVSSEDQLTADQLDLEMTPQQNRPRWLTATGNVSSTSQSVDGPWRRLETSALRLEFAPQGAANERHLARAESLAPAILEWRSAADSGKQETVRLRGQRVIAEFGENDTLETLTGHAGVRLERQRPGSPEQSSTAHEFAARFGANGDWIEAVESGDVRFREGDRTGEANHAKLDRVSDTVTLTGSAAVTDESSRTTAQSITLNRRTGDVHAQGSVRSTELPGKQNLMVHLTPEASILSSERLDANSTNGRAVYSGSARLWQGDAVIEADSIELIRNKRILNARGGVRSLFPETSTPSSGAAGGAPAGPPISGGRNRQDDSKPDLWRIRSQTLSYSGEDARAHFDGGVDAQSRQGHINSRQLDAYFSTAGPAGAGGAERLHRAVAHGDATVRQGDRKGTAERADYSSTEGKVVLSGGQPTLYDAFRGTTTGRQLTFYFASDTIVVDSEEGSRTLTRHRVEK